jgi:hypothetical protein
MRMAIRAPKKEMEANPTSLMILARSPTVRRARMRETRMDKAAKNRSR